MIIRLLRSGQYFTDMSMKKNKSGIRQKLNKSVIFQGLWSSGLVFSMTFDKYFIQYIFEAAALLLLAIWQKYYLED